MFRFCLGMRQGKYPRSQYRGESLFLKEFEETFPCERNL